LMHTVSYTSRMQPLIWTYGMHQFFCVLLGMSCLSLSLRYLAAHLHVRAKQLFNIHVQCMKLSDTQSTFFFVQNVSCSCSMHAPDQSPMCLSDAYKIVHASGLHPNVPQDRCGALHIVSVSLCVLPADFKQVLGQRGSKGPAPPSKLTAHQTQIVKALIEAHADDVQVYSTSCTQCRPSAVCTLSVRSVQSVQTPSQYTSRHVMLCPTACLQIF